MQRFTALHKAAQRGDETEARRLLEEVRWRMLQSNGEDETQWLTGEAQCKLFRENLGLPTQVKAQ